MPDSFSGYAKQTTAKPDVVFDGDTFQGAPTVLTSGSTATLTLSSTTITLTGGIGFRRVFGIRHWLLFPDHSDH